MEYEDQGDEVWGLDDRPMPQVGESSFHVTSKRNGGEPVNG